MCAWKLTALADRQDTLPYVQRLVVASASKEDVARYFVQVAGVASNNSTSTFHMFFAYEHGKSSLTAWVSTEYWIMSTTTIFCSQQALSAVVVDEMHLIGDTARGFLLELMLTKQRLLCPHNVQVRRIE